MTKSGVPVVLDVDNYPPETIERLNAAVAAVEADLDDPVPWRDLGMLYHAHLHYRLGQQCYRRAATLAPEDAKAWYFLAIVHNRLGDTEAATAAINRAADLAPGFAAVHWRRALWRLTEGDAAGAESSVRLSLELEPSSREARLIWARSLRQQGRLDQCTAVLRSLVDESPEDGYAWYLLGTALRQAGHLEQAREAVARSDTSPPKWVDAWMVEIWSLQTGYHADYMRASESLENDRPSEALRILDGALNDYPDEISLLLLKVRALRQLDRVDDAIAVLSHAREVHGPENRIALQAAGAFRSKAQRATGADRAALLETALANAEECISIDQGFALGHSMRGDVLLLMGRFDQAVASHRTARRINPGNALYATRLGAVLCAAQRWDDAVEPLSDAYRLNRDSLEIVALLGAALANSGQLDAAIELVTEAQTRMSDPRLAELQRRMIEARDKGGSG